MNLLNPFRAELGKLPYVNDVLDMLMAKINALWKVEHNQDGTHSAITATSLALTAPASGGGNISADLIPTSTSVDLGTLDSTVPGGGAVMRFGNAYVDAVHFGQGQVSLTGAVIPAWSLEASGTNLVWRARITSGRSITVQTVGAATLIQVGGTYDAGSGTGPDGVTIPTLSTTFTYATNGFRERSRGTNLGEWITPTYSAGDFTASTGSWTVDSGDITTFAYTLIGKTMVFAWDIGNTDVSANSVLRMALPAGVTIAKTMWSVHRYVDAGGATASGVVRALATNGYVEVFTGTGGTWTITAGDNTSTQGQITFEIA